MITTGVIMKVSRAGGAGLHNHRSMLSSLIQHRDAERGEFHPDSRYPLGAAWVTVIPAPGVVEKIDGRRRLRNIFDSSMSLWVHVTSPEPSYERSYF
jgi:hypothetical protein